MTAEPHCMHSESGIRTCCWCGFQQHREYTGSPKHGPYIPGDHRDFQWVPSSLQMCPERLENLGHRLVAVDAADEDLA